MATFKTLNPATGETLAELEIATSDQVNAAVKKAAQAFPNWKSLSYQERAHYILKARDRILQSIDEIAALITQENGKPLTESISADIMPVMDLATFYAAETEKILKKERLWLGKWNFMGRTSEIEYHPLGAVGIIAPWNYPFSIPCGQVMMALIAGNTVVLKPSEFTPLIGLKIQDIFNNVGLPEGVLQTVVGDGSTGAALIHSGVKKIFFTGSVPTGKKIMAAAAQTLTPVCLELGGKDPMIVLEDADLDVAASGAIWGAFGNSGQTCASVERVYVDERVAEKFKKLCLEKTQKLTQGQGSDADVEIGSMTAEMQINKVEKQVEAAKQAGAVALTGGTRPQSTGYFYPPTILDKVDHSMEVMFEETFGPILPIMTYKTIDEAITMANDSRYGLTASVWTTDIAKGKEIAKKLEAGTVTINECVYTYAVAQTPWGGPKESAIGRTHGKYGIMEMVEPMHIHANYTPRIKDFWWYGYDVKKYEMMKSLARTLFAHSLIEKMKSGLKFVWGQLTTRNI